MNCSSVRVKLAGYLDGALTGPARVRERAGVREHLEICADCREELQRFRKLGVLLSSLPKEMPPSNLAVRIKVAAAQAQASQGWRCAPNADSKPGGNITGQCFSSHHACLRQVDSFRRY